MCAAPFGLFFTFPPFSKLLHVLVYTQSKMLALKILIFQPRCAQTLSWANHPASTKTSHCPKPYNRIHCLLRLTGPDWCYFPFFSLAFRFWEFCICLVRSHYMIGCLKWGGATKLCTYFYDIAIIVRIFLASTDNTVWLDLQVVALKSNKAHLGWKTVSVLGVSK